FFFFNDTATTEIYTLSLHDALPIRRGGTSSDGDTSACTSTSSGREPSIAASTALPGARVASPTKRADASATSTRPPCFISKTPTSLVEPKRFLSARSVR